MENSFWINTSTRKTIELSFDEIADRLFNKYILSFNSTIYRIVDIEFYYYTKNEDLFKDEYAHKNDVQRTNGKWYFHPSGIDITIGNSVHFGGILLRGLVKLSESDFTIQKEIHGPQKIVTELFSNAFDVFSGNIEIKLVNIGKFGLNENKSYKQNSIKTTRINLAIERDETEEKNFYHGDYRYLILPSLKHAEKTKIATKMREQFNHLTIDQINKELGSKFLK